MIHPTPSRSFHNKGSAHTVLAMFKSEDLMAEGYPSPSTAVAVALPRANAKIDAGGARANATLLANALLPRSRSDTVIEDWTDLFDAVTARLRLVMAERHATSVESPSDEADRIRVNVLECVEALDQLHAALKEELGRSPQP